MDRPLLLRGARQLLTLRGGQGPRRGKACLDLGLIADGSVLIRDGHIVSVGQSSRVDKLAEARDAVVYDVHGAVVMPAFVDAEAALPSSVIMACRLLRLAFLHGTASMVLRAPYAVLRGFDGPGDGFARTVLSLDVEPGFDEGQLLRVSQRNLAPFFRTELLRHSRESLRFLHSLGPAIRACASAGANPDWVGLALAFGASVIEVGRLLNRHQVALLADSPACAVVTPASPGPAVRALLRQNAAVALGTGFADSAGATCSMQTAVQLACRRHGLEIAEAITLSTVNAAHAAGIGGICGSIETGKQANLLVLHISDIRDLSNYNGVNLVSKIVQAGTLVS
jgi:imidazolonepropionase